MAFINPNLITSGVSKEEFENLKKEVSSLALDVSKLKENNIKISNSGYKLVNKNIKNAKLMGIPRIDYFNFNKVKQEVKEESANNNDNVVDTIIELNEVLNIDKSYKINRNDLPNIVKTSSSHRTITMNENKALNIKNSYYDTMVKSA